MKKNIDLCKLMIRDYILMQNNDFQLQYNLINVKKDIEVIFYCVKYEEKWEDVGYFIFNKYDF